MKRILAACALLLAGAWASGQVNGQGGVYINGVLQAAASWDYLHAGGISMVDPTSDAAPDPLLLKGANAWPGAATNTTGANTVLAGGIGKRIYTIVDYTALGSSTVTVTVNGTATVLTEGVEWTAATSNNATATSLAAAVDAITGVSASSSSAVVRIVPDAGTYSVVIAKSAADAAITATSGTDGNVSGRRFIGVDSIGISASADASLNFTSGGTVHWTFTESVTGPLTFSYNNGAAYPAALKSTGLNLSSTSQLGFTVSGDPAAAPDVGIARESAAIVKITDGSTGFGAVSLDTNSKILADTVSLSDNVKTAVLDIAIADAEFIGGTLTYTVTSTDGTDGQTLTGIAGFSAFRKAGTPDTYHLEISESASPVLAESTGTSTLTDTWAIDEGTDEFTISVTADSSLTTPTMTVRYQLVLNSANLPTKK